MRGGTLTMTVTVVIATPNGGEALDEVKAFVIVPMFPSVGRGGLMIEINRFRSRASQNRVAQLHR